MMDANTPLTVDTIAFAAQAQKELREIGFPHAEVTFASKLPKGAEYIVHGVVAVSPKVPIVHTSLQLISLIESARAHRPVPLKKAAGRKIKLGRAQVPTQRRTAIERIADSIVETRANEVTEALRKEFRDRASELEDTAHGLRLRLSSAESYSERHLNENNCLRERLLALQSEVSALRCDASIKGKVRNVDRELERRRDVSAVVEALSVYLGIEPADRELIEADFTPTFTHALVNDSVEKYIAELAEDD